MSIEQAIHERWATAAELVALLPAAHLITGTVHNSLAMPYAVLTQTESQRVRRTSSGTVISRTALRLSIWAGNLDSGKAIADLADQLLDRTSFDLAEGRVLNLERVHGVEQSQVDGAWLLALDYVALHEQQT
jgi:hypothetical protein